MRNILDVGITGRNNKTLLQLSIEVPTAFGISRSKAYLPTHSAKSQLLKRPIAFDQHWNYIRFQRD